MGRRLHVQVVLLYFEWFFVRFRSVVFAAAAYQGAEFASTKPSATAWGGVIGFAAFLAWLAVDEEEACEGGGAQEDEDAALDLDDDDDEPVAESHAKSD